MNAETSIRVGIAQGAVWVRVEGKGNFQNSTALKDFAREMLARGHSRFVFDLLSCPMMDSTFMGTLAGIALKLQAQSSEGKVEVVNLNDRTRSLLSNLGLDQLLDLQATGQVGVEVSLASDALLLKKEDKKEQAQTMLDAHQAVVDANPLNEAKFKDVLEYLRQDLEAKP